MKSIKGINIKGKRVLLRVDFNVPLKNGKVADDTKIKAHVPTIEYLVEKGAKITLISHLGRPKGKKVKDLSLKPVHQVLENILRKTVLFIPEVWGKNVEDKVNKLKDGEICLLENLRFEKGEEENDIFLAERLARLGDLFVQDAFSACHRGHVSTIGIPKILPCYAGFLLEKEVENLTKYILNPKKPFICIIGGAKISTKINALKAIVKKADVLILGGGMANTFLMAEGYEIGKSVHEEECLDEADDILREAVDHGVEVLLPSDVLVAKKAEEEAKVEEKEVAQVGGRDIIVDIGSKTIESLKEPINFAGSVFWNGPMGINEVEAFSGGTKALATFLIESGNTSVVGGGDTLAALESDDLKNKFTYVSTGGGAILDFIEKEGKLPGILALD